MSSTRSAALGYQISGWPTGALPATSTSSSLTRGPPKVFTPVVAPKDQQRDRHEPLPSDTKALGQWRERMGTDAAKQIYKDRAASIECANAHLRNRGLQRFNVRGLMKARAVLLCHALVHNLKRMMALNFAFAA